MLRKLCSVNLFQTTCNSRFRLCLGVLLMTLLLTFVWRVEAEAAVMQTHHLTIYYQNPHQLTELGHELRPSALTQTLNTIFLGSSGDPGGTLGSFLDQLLKRVQLILAMPLPRLHINIRLYPTQRQLTAAGEHVTGIDIGAPAFYVRDTNTIYLQLQDLRIGILAHEMGHAVLDHYFAIQPPDRVAELLCQYVDKQVSSENF